MSTNTASAYTNQPRNKHSLGWFVSKVRLSLASHFQPHVFWSLHAAQPPPAGLKASAGATKPSTQRVPGGLEMCYINLTTTHFQPHVCRFFAPAGRKNDTQ